jgi:hypothetical protein
MNPIMSEDQKTRKLTDFNLENIIPVCHQKQSSHLELATYPTRIFLVVCNNRIID